MRKLVLILLAFIAAVTFIRAYDTIAAGDAPSGFSAAITDIRPDR